jgi:hypothetical protein
MTLKARRKAYRRAVRDARADAKRPGLARRLLAHISILWDCRW